VDLLLNLIPAPYRFVAKIAIYGLLVLGAVAALAAIKHSYDERVRAPLRQELADLRAQIEANKTEAARQIAQREAENKKAIDGYTQYARTSDETHAAELARLRAARNAADGVRFVDPFGRRSCTAAGQAGKSDSGTPETAAAAGELSGELAAFLRAEAERADEVAAYANSCHRFVNGR
jgi:hypothetical protein